MGFGMTVRRCSNCGEEDYEYMMWPMNTGRAQWLCNSCYQEGHRQVRYREIAEQKRKAKLADQIKKK